MEDGEEGAGGLVVSGGYAPELLQAPDNAHDYIAGRNPQVVWYVKAAAVAIAAYALSPIDFIPVLGYLDEAILLPVVIALVIRMIPVPLMAEFREEAQRRSERPVSRVAAIIALWIAAATFLLWTLWTTSAT